MAFPIKKRLICDHKANNLKVSIVFILLTGIDDSIKSTYSTFMQMDEIIKTEIIWLFIQEWISVKNCTGNA